MGAVLADSTTLQKGKFNGRIQSSLRAHGELEAGASPFSAGPIPSFRICFFLQSLPDLVSVLLWLSEGQGRHAPGPPGNSSFAGVSCPKEPQGTPSNAARSLPGASLIPPKDVSKPLFSTQPTASPAVFSIPRGGGDH